MRQVLAVTVILVLARAAAAQPSGGPASAPTSAPTAPRGVAARPTPRAPTTSRPAVAPARDARAQELRFDALRIDGALHGPEAVTIRSDLARRVSPLHRLRRSFMRRILRTVESPCLHR